MHHNNNKLILSSTFCLPRWNKWEHWSLTMERPQVSDASSQQMEQRVAAAASSTITINQKQTLLLFFHSWTETGRLWSEKRRLWSEKRTKNGKKNKITWWTWILIFAEKNKILRMSLCVGTCSSITGVFLNLIVGNSAHAYFNFFRLSMLEFMLLKIMAQYKINTWTSFLYWLGHSWTSSVWRVVWECNFTSINRIITWKSLFWQKLSRAHIPFYYMSNRSKNPINPFEWPNYPLYY